MRRSGVVLLILLLVALLPASASGASAFCEQLRSGLTSGGGAASGLFVVDADSGKVVCARAAKRRRPLASNMKLFTTSTALSRFGPDYRIATKLLGDGEVDDRGVLHGSLYLQGGGDPALGSPAFYDRFLGGVGTNMFALRAQLRAAGVRAVTGRLYADDTVFDRLRGVADSGYATSSYIGPLSGLSFNAGYRDSRASGIAIRTAPALRAAPAGAPTLGTVRSPSMEELVETTDVYSDNFFAEMLLKLIGAHFGSAGSTRAGARVVERFARALGSGVHAVDGSGLTRSNRASPQQIVRLLVAMRNDPVGEQFTAALALAGHTGTVASRMRGTAADGHCRTKTGTLTGVSNLSGYCFTRDGQTMAFSILMGSVRSLSLAHAEQDRIAAAIASY
jgi:D-alanyl-D-alanine carboxypeptidase/D-alanyl-D-alanine-endopeptidase (penicillin-binding protein 4)